MPNSGAVWMAAGLLWVLDASINITMEPFRAFVGDLLPAEQRKSGFAMQSLLIGLGAVLSSALPYILTNWFGVTGSNSHGGIPRTVQLAFYIGSAVVFAFVLLALVRTHSARAIHRVCLLCGGAGLISAFLLREQYPLLISMALVGVAWASILSMPYAMLSNSIPSSKMGFYMGVFNFFIVIPQILASLGLGALMKAFLRDNPMNAVLLGGCSMIVAALCVSFVSK